MKILHIVNPVLPFPANTVGGTERVVQYLIEELLLEGHEITLAGHDDSSVPKGVRFVPIGTFQNQKKSVKIVWKHLLTNKYDVIHNHGRFIYFLPVIWTRVRKIHTLHLADLGEKTFNLFFKLKPKNLTLCPCAKWIQEKYSDYLGDWRYVNNGIPLHLYKFNQSTINDFSPLTIIARMSSGKGITDAIELAKLTGNKLIIAGKIGDTNEEITWFEKNVLSMCDDEQIRFIGPVNDLQKQELLSNSKGLLMLSKDSEAFNLTMLEANACGCPVISYNRYFPKVFIKEGVNGYIGENNDTLAKKVNRLSQINRLGCRKDFEENYTSKHMATNYLKLYKLKI